MKGSAFFSDCRKYRYTLSRVWNAKLPSVLFVMLNPSTADAIKFDPTVRRCFGYAVDWGFGALMVGNLFAYRSTDPNKLNSVIDPVGPYNQKAIRNMHEIADLTVAAWGDKIPRPYNKNDWFDWIPPRKEMHYLKLTKSGRPRHPLYLKKDLEPIRFE